ncbi:reverse transcriptase domain-containing protein [Tanacetum coccineum]
MDQMIERLAENEFYCFLDGFSGYFQIPIDPQDQKKTTFTCPYGTFAYRRMPFCLCNAPSTFQRCMMAIFHDMIEKTMEVFMDDFTVIGDNFDLCLSNLEKMLKWCEDTNLVLNWEKCHFMCREGIVLGHKILNSGIEVNRVKVDVIAKLPHPTTVKGVRSFLGVESFEEVDISFLSIKVVKVCLIKDMGCMLWHEVGKVKVLRVLEMMEHDSGACIYGALVSVDTNDIFSNNEFLILDVRRKIISKDNGRI